MNDIHYISLFRFLCISQFLYVLIFSLASYLSLSPGEASVVPATKSSPLAHQSDPTRPHSPPYLEVNIYLITADLPWSVFGFTILQIAEHPKHQQLYNKYGFPRVLFGPIVCLWRLTNSSYSWTLPQTEDNFAACFQNISPEWSESKRKVILWNVTIWRKRYVIICVPHLWKWVHWVVAICTEGGDDTPTKMETILYVSISLKVMETISCVLRSLKQCGK